MKRLATVLAAALSVSVVASALAAVGEDKMMYKEQSKGEIMMMIKSRATKMRQTPRAILEAKKKKDVSRAMHMMKKKMMMQKQSSSSASSSAASSS